MCTAWRHIMAQTSSWHKTEEKIFIVIRLPSVKLVYFRIANKEVDVTIPIQNTVSVVSCCLHFDVTIHCMLTFIFLGVIYLNIVCST